MRTKYNSQRSDKSDRSRSTGKPAQPTKADIDGLLWTALACYKHYEDSAGDRNLKAAMVLSCQPQEKFEEYRDRLIAEARPKPILAELRMCSECQLLPAVEPHTEPCELCIQDFEDCRLEAIQEKLRPYCVA